MNDGHSNLESIRLSNRGADDSQRRVELLRESSEITHRDLSQLSERWETRFGKLGMPVYYNTGQEKAGYLLGVACEVRERGKGQNGSVDRYTAITGRIQWTPQALDQIRSQEYKYIDARLGEVDDALEIVSVSLTNRTASALNPIEISLSDSRDGRGKYARYANELAPFRNQGERFYRELITLIGRDRGERENIPESRARQLALRDDPDLALCLAGVKAKRVYDPNERDQSGERVFEAACRIHKCVEPGLTERAAMLLAGGIAPDALMLKAIELGVYR